MLKFWRRYRMVLAERDRLGEELRALRNDYQQMESLYANTPLILIWLDKEGHIRNIRDGGAHIIERPAEELIGLSYGEAMDCIHYPHDAGSCGSTPYCKDCPMWNMIRETLNRGSDIRGKEIQQVLRRGGSTCAMTFQVSTTRLDKNNESMVLMRILDITDRKAMEEELQKVNHQLMKTREMSQDGNRLKESFLSNMSHEIRTPINGIMGFTQILLERKTDEQQTREYLEIIYQQTGKLLGNINDLIEISKAASNQLQMQATRFNVINLLHNLRQCYSRKLEAGDEAAVSLKLDFPDTSDAVFIRADQQKLRQVLEHLLDNALKFTFEGGIKLGFEIADEREFHFYVQDTGIGIPQGKQSEVFDSFRQVDEGFSRQHQGSGLGLTLAKHYVEIMGGCIGLHSEEGKGSCFYFRIPRHPEAGFSPEVPKTMDEPVPSWDDRTLLLVEDDPSSQLYLREALDPTGVKVLLSETGGHALQLLEKVEQPDLVLMDVRLPDISGLDVIRKIREAGHHIPIIAQTAHAMDNDRRKCLQAGADDYITKPVGISNLLSTVARLIDGDSR
ncbi:MAG TPA: response regulator [Bacteroidales bacterium]|nr:response regulator [Bacteroidales bacterium]